MKNPKLVSIALKVFGLCMVVIELVIYFSKEEFNQLSFGWMIFGGLLMSSLGIAMLCFVVAGIIDDMAKKSV
ncbi:hypothetical protein HYW54_01085 [Candidatus Gottesmanbacteria bacterium]|nr:hypothetical protein [Candidatus Gottesmanbacteria bacterium]